ncbi:MAG: barstar family protein [Actinomycetota bacterium]|nr:barstar family protein [Actinomycetota bacterium]
MSGLAALLAGHNEPDIYLWHSAAHVPDVQHAVERAGWGFVRIDGWAVEDKQSLLEATATAFDLAEPLRDSFDALSDALADIITDDREGVVLLWDGWGPLARADMQAFSIALSVFGGRVNAERGGRFAVVLRGEGPPIDVPELLAKPTAR